MQPNPLSAFAESLGFKIIKFRQDRDMTEDDLAQGINDFAEHHKGTVVEVKDVCEWQSNISVPPEEVFQSMVEILINHNPAIALDKKTEEARQFRIAYNTRNPNKPSFFALKLNTLMASAQTDSTKLAKALGAQNKLDVEAVDWADIAHIQSGNKEPGDTLVIAIIHALYAKKPLTEAEITELYQSYKPGGDIKFVTRYLTGSIPAARPVIVAPPPPAPPAATSEPPSAPPAPPAEPAKLVPIADDGIPTLHSLLEIIRNTPHQSKPKMPPKQSGASDYILAQEFKPQQLSNDAKLNELLNLFYLIKFRIAETFVSENRVIPHLRTFLRENHPVLDISDEQAKTHAPMLGNLISPGSASLTSFDNCSQPTLMRRFAEKLLESQGLAHRQANLDALLLMMDNIKLQLSKQLGKPGEPAKHLDESLKMDLRVTGPIIFVPAENTKPSAPTKTRELNPKPTLEAIIEEVRKEPKHKPRRPTKSDSDRTNFILEASFKACDFTDDENLNNLLNAYYLTRFTIGELLATKNRGFPRLKEFFETSRSQLGLTRSYEITNATSNLGAVLSPTTNSLVASNSVFPKHLALFLASLGKPELADPILAYVKVLDQVKEKLSAVFAGYNSPSTIPDDFKTCLNTPKHTAAKQLTVEDIPQTRLRQIKSKPWAINMVEDEFPETLINNVTLYYFLRERLNGYFKKGSGADYKLIGAKAGLAYNQVAVAIGSTTSTLGAVTRATCDKLENYLRSNGLGENVQSFKDDMAEMNRIRALLREDNQLTKGYGGGVVIRMRYQDANARTRS